MTKPESALEKEVRKLRGTVSRQRMLVEASYALHTSLDLDTLLELILDTASAGVGADRGTVFLLDEETGSLWSRVLSGDERLEIRLPVGQGIAGSVAESGKTIRIEDAYADPRFDRSWDERSGYRTRRILCAPIRNRRGKLVGVFQLLNKQSGPFTDEDEEYLASLSVHAALALENARLHASALEKERYDREVRLARSVQRQLQPEQRAERQGCIAVAGMNELCEDATGDYYDVLIHLPGDRLGVAVGDVSGHGLQAALVMAEARAFLRAFVHAAPSLPAAMDLLNDYLVPDLEGGRFLSLFAAVFDTASGAMEWCNAGHNPPLLRRAGGEIEALRATGRILGILPDAAYRTGREVRLDEGDTLLLYTDGITEARSPHGELFGEERLREALAASTHRDPSQVLAALRRCVAAWTGRKRNEDDLTMMVVQRASPEKTGAD